MRGITRLDVIEIEKHDSLAEDMGAKAQSALMEYHAGLDRLVMSTFGPKDNSSVHEVINALMLSVTSISQSMEEVDDMIDCLMNMIKNDIIQKEDEMALNVDD